MARVAAAGGDTGDRNLVLSESALQFGQYRAKPLSDTDKLPPNLLGMAPQGTWLFVVCLLLNLLFI